MHWCSLNYYSNIWMGDLVSIWSRFYNTGHCSSYGLLVTIKIVTLIPAEKYKLKNHTHVKKVGHTSEFLSAIYWWTWKTNNYQKNEKSTRRYHHFTLYSCVPKIMIISSMCTTNDNHMIYGSWDIECDRHNFLSFLTSFCPFIPLTT